MGSQVQLNLETQLPPLLFGADLFPVVWQGILCKYSQRKLLKERLCRQLLGAQARYLPNGIWSGHKMRHGDKIFC